MKVRHLVILALFVLLIPAFFTPIGPTSFDRNLTADAGSQLSTLGNTPSIPNGMPIIPSPDYFGIGTARNVAEYANRTDASQNLHLIYDSTTGIRYNDTAQAVLPPGWEGYMLYTYIYQIAENRSWILNPEFNNTAQYWNNITFDGGSWTNVITNYYRATGHGAGNPAVECFIDGFDRTGGWYSYDPQDYARWNQTFPVPPRGQVLSASVSFDYWVQTDSVWGLGLPFQVYARVDGQYVYSIGFDNVMVPEATWTNTGIQTFSPSIVNLSDGLNVQVGLRYTGDSSTRFSPDPQPRARFDNVIVYIQTLVRPSDINLQMNGLDIIDDTFGVGHVTENQLGSPWVSSPVVAALNWTPITFPPDPDMDMDVTLIVDTNLYGQKFGTTLYAQDPFSPGTRFTATSGSDTTWKMYYQLAMPTGYWNDHFNFTIPTDWDIVFVSEPQLPTVNVVGQCQGGNLGDGYLSIPSTVITNSPDGYWYIEAESHNYVDSAELQIWDGGWTPTSDIRAGNTTRVVAQILDGSNNPPAGVTSTQANVTIYQPGGGLWYTESVTPTAAGWVYSSSFYNAGWNTTGGTYSVSVTWDNSTEAGENSFTYSMEHSTTLTPREPLIESFLEDQPLFPKVRYEDSDSHAWLEPPATIEGNWTTGTITFNYVSGTGYWEAEINAQDPGTVGQYWIRVNASKSSYDDASCIIIIDLVSETKVETPQSGGVEVPWRGNTTINIRYSQIVGDVGITGAEVTVNWTAGFYEVTEGADGWYNVEINSTGPGSIGSYLLNITLYKERYQRQQVRIALFVTPMTLVVTSTVSEPVNVVYGEQFWVEVYVENFLGEPFNTANVTFSWTGGSTYNDTGINALYGAWLNSSLGNIGIHYLTAYVTGPNAVPEIHYVLINVEQIGSILDTVPPGNYYLTYIVGESFPLPVNYTTQYGDGVELAFVTYTVGHLNGTYNEVGGGIYNVTIDTTGLVAGSYTIYVTASSPNVDSQSRAVSLILTLSPAALEPESSVLNVYWGDDFKVNVFYRNLVNDSGIPNADIYYLWGNLTGTLSPNITMGIGWYYIDLPSDIFAAGAIYDVTLTCQKPSFQFSLATVTINILSVPADLTLVRVKTIYQLNGQNITTELELANWQVPRGEILWLYFNYTDWDGSQIIGATGNYDWGFGLGTIVFENGYYIAKIDMTNALPGSYYLSASLTRQNYERGQITQMGLTVIAVPTAITGMEETIHRNTGELIWITVTLEDTYHNLMLSDASLYISIPTLNIEDQNMTNNGDGTYSFGPISFPLQGQYEIAIRSVTPAIYAEAQLSITVSVTLDPLVVEGIRWGLFAAIIGIILLLAWLAYTRVFAIPWLVRKMRKMSQTLGKGRTPHLSNRDINRIATRPDSMSGIAEPAYDAIGLPAGATVLPAAITIEEREAEDEIVWQELEKLEGLGHDQKLELFEEMKRIPAKDRVWFLEDLKAQMADGTRFGRVPAEPTAVPEGVDPLVHARLEALEVLGPAEKEAVVEQLRGLSKEEQEEVIRALEETERQSG
ncbi:MAG: hypothetical protein ACFFAL_00220 [Promethearchaeota archaeon]